jgi:hypothetical protein
LQKVDIYSFSHSQHWKIKIKMLLKDRMRRELKRFNWNLSQCSIYRLIELSNTKNGSERISSFRSLNLYFIFLRLHWVVDHFGVCCWLVLVINWIGNSTIQQFNNSQQISYHFVDGKTNSFHITCKSISNLSSDLLQSKRLRERCEME